MQHTCLSAKACGVAGGVSPKHVNCCTATREIKVSEFTLPPIRKWLAVKREEDLPSHRHVHRKQGFQKAKPHKQNWGCLGLWMETHFRGERWGVGKSQGGEGGRIPNIVLSFCYCCWVGVEGLGNVFPSCVSFCFYNITSSLDFLLHTFCIQCLVCLVLNGSQTYAFGVVLSKLRGELSCPGRDRWEAGNPSSLTFRGRCKVWGQPPLACILMTLLSGFRSLGEVAGLIFLL